jgi:hypothetical protein
MSWEQVTYNRDRLYEEVWTSPVERVAKKYGVSGTALAKVCRKLNVPLPGRGYWARAEVGKQDPKPPLPPLKEGEKAEIVASRSVSPLVQVGIREETKRLTAAERDADNRIEVAASLERPHPIVRDALKLLREAKWRDPITHAEQCLDVDVTLTCLDRALRIMDALIKALVARGFAVEVTPLGPKDQWGNTYFERSVATPSRTVVRIGEERVQFGIEEAHDSVEVPRKKSTFDSLFPRGPEREARPNGKLMIKIRNPPMSSSVRQTWRDGKTQRVEECLNDVVRGLILMAEAIRAERLEREERDRRWEEERRRAAEEAKRLADEKAKVDELDGYLSRWRRVREIYAFVEDVIRARGPIPLGSKLDKWIDWVRAYARSIDPLQPR